MAREQVRRPSSGGVGRLARVGARAAAPLVAWAACRSTPPPAPTQVVFSVRSDDGSPIAGAQLVAGSTVVALTEWDGRAKLSVTGAEGDAYAVRIRCPQGFLSPPDPFVIRRMTMSGAAGAPEYSVLCQQTRHTLVVVVKADGAGDLPVVYLGKEVARTDRFGAAVTTVKMDVHERVELTLATQGKENEGLHPQNPVGVFEMPDHDDIQVFSVKFVRDRKKPVGRSAPHGPKLF